MLSSDEMMARVRTAFPGATFTGTFVCERLWNPETNRIALRLESMATDFHAGWYCVALNGEGRPIWSKGVNLYGNPEPVWKAAYLPSRSEASVWVALV